MHHGGVVCPFGEGKDHCFHGYAKKTIPGAGFRELLFSEMNSKYTFKIVGFCLIQVILRAYLMSYDTFKIWPLFIVIIIIIIIACGKGMELETGTQNGWTK